MFDTKREIILDEGLPVDVIDWQGNTLFSTKALLGKATKQFFSEISLEYHRKAQFVPELDVKNGQIVRVIPTGEHYLIMATYNEVFGTEKLATITRLVECNNEVLIQTLVETADDDGNIYRTPTPIVNGLKAYVEMKGGDLVQYKPGLQSRLEFDVYIPVIDVEVLDQIHLNINGKFVPFKVEYIDELSFQGIMILRVSTETRR